MKSRIVTLSWIGILCACIVWAAFGAMVWQLGEMRLRIAQHETEERAQVERDKISAQLQTLMRDTREKRQTLNELIRTDALAAAATIEAAGKKAGVSVTIDAAVASELDHAAASEVRIVVIVAQAEGEFSDLMKAASLFETLPFPSSVESYVLSSLKPTKNHPDPWRMQTRIRILMPAETTL